MLIEKKCTECGKLVLRSDSDVNTAICLECSEHDPCPICEARAAERVRREEVEPLRRALQRLVITHGCDYYVHEPPDCADCYDARRALAKAKP